MGGVPRVMSSALGLKRPAQAASAPAPAVPAPLATTASEPSAAPRNERASRASLIRRLSASVPVVPSENLRAADQYRRQREVVVEHLLQEHSGLFDSAAEVRQDFRRLLEAHEGKVKVNKFDDAVIRMLAGHLPPEGRKSKELVSQATRLYKRAVVDTLNSAD